MATAKDVKEKYLNYLLGMDLGKMDVSGLIGYGYVVKNLEEMERQAYAETQAIIMALFASAFKKEEGEEKKESEVSNLG